MYPYNVAYLMSILPACPLCQAFIGQYKQEPGLSLDTELNVLQSVSIINLAGNPQILYYGQPLDCKFGAKIIIPGKEIQS